METALNTQDRVQDPRAAPVTGSSRFKIMPRDSLLLSDCCKATKGANAAEPFATLLRQPPRSSSTAISRDGAANKGSINVESKAEVPQDRVASQRSLSGLQNLKESHRVWGV